MHEHIKTLLQWYKDSGCDCLFEECEIRPKKTPAAPPATTAPNSSEVIAQRCTSLSQLVSAIKDFELCDLKKSALSTVVFDGNPSAKIMLIGEAPGAMEDQQGIPFCGQSGKLLDNIIKAIGLDRTNTYITNTVFWRPPGNRRPTPEEIAICRPFLERQIGFIAPKVMVMVGSTAIESLLGIQQQIGELRQRILPYRNRYLPSPISSMVIYHPSYLLRQPYKKKEMWHDMQFLQQLLTSHE